MVKKHVMNERARIPFADPRSDLAGLRNDIIAAVARVIDSGCYVLGSEVATFEDRLSRRLGTAGSVGVGCCTEALVLALLAHGVGPGDEVITVSHTAGPTVAAILMTGATPVLVDVDPATYCLDSATLDAALSPRAKAIIPVHLYGHPADLLSISRFAREHSLFVIEDCAQAQDATFEGRPVGSVGDAGCFSFYPTKNLGGVGDGGAVTACVGETVERMRHLRTYGWTTPQYAEIANGRCSRLDEVQAAILNVKLDCLAQAIDRRREIAHQYDDAFSGLQLISPIERAGCRHVYHLYVVRCDRRDALAQHLDRAGISTGLHYPLPVHKQPAFARIARIPGPLRATERIATEILTLPLYPTMARKNVERVVDAVRSFFL
jgi:dTDP-4-amino-4,6-dideoxygalactose transaminase